MSPVQCAWGDCYAMLPDAQTLAVHVIEHARDAPERPKKRQRVEPEPDVARRSETLVPAEAAPVLPAPVSQEALVLSAEEHRGSQSTHSYIPRPPDGPTSAETSNGSGSINPPVEVSTSNPSKSEHDSTTVYDTSSKSDSQPRSQSRSQPSISAPGDAFALRNAALLQSQLPPPPSPQIGSSNPINAHVEPEESSQEESERIIETQAPLRPLLNDEGFSEEDLSDEEGISFSGPLSQTGPFIVQSIEVGGHSRRV